MIRAAYIDSREPNIEGSMETIVALEVSAGPRPVLIGREVVGMLRFFTTIVSEGGFQREIGFIREIFVEETHRRSGVGTMLLDHATTILSERMKPRDTFGKLNPLIQAGIFASNKPSIALFEKAGFQCLGAQPRGKTLLFSRKPEFTKGSQ